ncbi:transposase [Rhizobium alvei]
MALAIIAGLPVVRAAKVYGVSDKIVARWVERFKAGRREAMLDRTSRPLSRSHFIFVVCGLHWCQYFS